MEWFLDFKITTDKGDVVTQHHFPMSALGQYTCVRGHTICFERTPLIDGNACLLGLTITPDIIPYGYDDASAKVDSEPPSMLPSPHEHQSQQRDTQEPA